MGAHRRTPRSTAVQGLVRFSAVALTVGAAAVATALGGPKNDSAQDLATVAALDTPTDQDDGNGGDRAPSGAPTATVSSAPAPMPAPPTARPSSAPSAPAPVVKRAAAPKVVPRAARTTPASKPAARAKPTAQKRGAAPGSSGFTSGYPTGRDARGAVNSALAAAKADGKKVLIDFGANWCGNCKAADEVFATRGVGALLDASYHVVKVDIGGSDSAALSLLGSYCTGEGAYKMPVLVVLDGNGKVLTETHSTGNPDLTDAGLGAFLRKWA